MKRRLLVVTGVLLGVSLFVRAAAAPARPLGTPVLPPVIDRWSGADAPPLDADTERVLGADWYVNRIYRADSLPPVGVYIAYYASQRPGVSIHSPLHCLPGTGWEAVETATLAVPTPGVGGTPAVRSMIVRKHADRALVLYWYDVHGRVVANEAASKLWLLHDAFTSRRSDAALVRIVVPMDEGPAPAERIGRTFVTALTPLLSALWS